MKIGDLKKVNGVISRLEGYSASQDNPLDIEFKFIELLTDRAIFVNFSKLETIEDVTQEEIDSVKPQFKRGDVVGYCDDIKTYGRLGDFKNNIFSGLSRFDCFGSFNFDVHSWISKEDVILPTPDQIKQLELEEMKHGKKWNGEGYDDWLTADGLTWNELIEHSVGDIEYNSDEGWVLTNNTTTSLIRGHNSSPIMYIKRYRLKPKETFVDCRITWKPTEANVTPPFSKNDGYDLSDFKIGVPRGGWVLSGYVYKSDIEDEKGNDFHPMRFYNSGRKVQEKATHARFVKVGE